MGASTMSSSFDKMSLTVTIESADTDNDNMSQDRLKDASTINNLSAPNCAPKRTRKVPLDCAPTRQPARDRPTLPVPLRNGVSSISIPPTTFDKFVDLPAELRGRIWKYALQGPRTIKIKFSRQVLNYIPPKRPTFRRGYKIKSAQLTYRFKCTGENPGTLLACSESRYYSLKRLPNAIRLYTDGQLIRFDGSIDTFFVDNTSLVVYSEFRYSSSERHLRGSENVQFVAVQNPEIFHGGLVNLVCHFGGIKAVHTGFTANEQVDSAEHIEATLIEEFRNQLHEKVGGGELTEDQQLLLDREVAEIKLHVKWSHQLSKWSRYHTSTAREPFVVENDMDAWEELITVFGEGSEGEGEDVAAST